MTVYDLDTIQYKVIGSVKETKTDGGQEVLFFNCEASDGSKCHLMFINQDTTVSFIIYYSNFNMCYNIKDLK
jgi:hypothetical protein